MRGHFVAVVSYEYMNIFNGHLSQGRFPADKFPSKGTDSSRPPFALRTTLFSLHFIPARKMRTTASVFDYGYFKMKFIFAPEGLKAIDASARA